MNGVIRHARGSSRFARIRIVAILAAIVTAPATAQVGDARWKDIALIERVDDSAKRCAVVVGIDGYQHRLRKLSYATKDARDVAKVLEDSGFIVSRMTMDAPDPQLYPINAAVIERELREVVSLLQANDTVLFYYSGHGFVDADKNGYVCAFDTNPESPATLGATGLSLSKIRSIFESARCQKRLVIIDACRNDPAKGPMSAGYSEEDLRASVGTGVLYATAPGMVSFEPDDGDRDSTGAPIRNGVFTHYLLRGLSGEAKLNEDAYLTFREVSYWVGEAMRDHGLRSKKHREQRPFMDWVGGTIDDVLLRRLPNADANAGTPTDPAEIEPPPSRPERAPSGDVIWPRIEPDGTSYAAAQAAAPPGLEFLGVNPRSGLAEYWLPRSGSKPRVDERTGAIAMTAESAIVFVLLPAARVHLGAQSLDRSLPNFEPVASASSRVREADLPPIFFSRFEIHQAQWRRIGGVATSLNYGRQESAAQNDVYPVEMVSYNAAEQGLARIGCRLPTADEWEYAVRTSVPASYVERLLESPAAFENCADSSAPEVWGSRDAGVDDGFAGTSPIGRFRPNAFGLHDLLGNVSEWVVRPAADEPTASGARAHYRGGAFLQPADRARIWSVRQASREAERPFVGVRAVMDVVEGE